MLPVCPAPAPPCVEEMRCAFWTGFGQRSYLAQQVVVGVTVQGRLSAFRAKPNRALVHTLSGFLKGRTGRHSGSQLWQHLCRSHTSCQLKALSPESCSSLVTLKGDPDSKSCPDRKDAPSAGDLSLQT